MCVCTNNKMASQAKPWFRTSLECFVKLLESNKKAIGLCTAQSKMLLFCVKAITKESHNFELVHLKKKTNFGHFATFWFGTYAMHFHATRTLAGHENTRRRLVCCCKVYLCIIVCCVSTLSLHITRIKTLKM